MSGVIVLLICRKPNYKHRENKNNITMVIGKKNQNYNNNKSDEINF